MGDPVLINFFYSYPTWVVGLVVIGVWTGLSLLGLYIFRPVIDVHVREKNTGPSALPMRSSRSCSPCSLP